MPEEKRKIPRLGKAAGEFNVSISTITALLNKKNFDIEDNPNTKLTEEMYDILLYEFAGEKLVKAEADKIDIGTFNSKNKTEAKAKVSKEEVEDPVDEDALIIKNTVINPTQHIDTEVPTPKIVGKIDLEELSPKKKTKAAVKEEAEELPEPAKETVFETINQPVQEEKPKEIPVPEHIETVVTSLEQPKVIDKIDLSSLEKKKKKHSAPKEEEPVEAKAEEDSKPEAAVESKPDIKTPANHQEAERKIEFIETRVEKIQGPKIMGKIELPVEKPKESTKKENRSGNTNNNNNSEANKKRRRKRIPVKQAGVKNSQGKDEKNNKQEPEKVEISPEDIQRRIKETKQRLEPTGKTKASKRRKEKRQLIHERLEEQELLEIENKLLTALFQYLGALVPCILYVKKFENLWGHKMLWLFIKIRIFHSAFLIHIYCKALKQTEIMEASDTNRK